MSNVNDLMDELEQETKELRHVSGLEDAVPLSTVIDRILSEDTDKKRKLADG